MPPQKGKAPTKGAKQILSENTSTVKFYRNMSLGAGLTYNIIVLSFYKDSLSPLILILNFLVTAIYIGCYQMMIYISRPKFADKEQLIDPGLDLNMEGGMGEHVKDIVILCSITHLLTIISNWFWLLLLLLPLRAMYMLWTNLLGPWFFQEAPQNTEPDEKKRKKLERKMKRFSH